MNRKKVFTGSPWEPVVGYCRAIRIGDRIEVAGTTAMKDGEVVGVGDAYAQTRFILETIEKALRELDGYKVAETQRKAAEEAAEEVQNDEATD